MLTVGLLAMLVKGPPCVSRSRLAVRRQNSLWKQIQRDTYLQTQIVKVQKILFDFSLKVLIAIIGLGLLKASWKTQSCQSSQSFPQKPFRDFPEIPQRLPTDVSNLLSPRCYPDASQLAQMVPR